MLPFFKFLLNAIYLVIVLISPDRISQILGPKAEILSVPCNTVLTFVV